jgi:integrase
VSATSAWHKRLQDVFEVANIKPALSHRFRHTFATDLLTPKPGVPALPLELVSAYVGHSNPNVTIKHYSHWIEPRIQATSDVLRDRYKQAS